jgi:hypothetical protein
MMSESPSAVDSVRRSVSTITNGVVEVVSTLLLVAFVAVWSLFWGAVVRIHYMQGDLTSAMFTTTLFVVPAAGGLVWYGGQSLDIEISTPDIEANILSS